MNDLGLLLAFDYNMGDYEQRLNKEEELRLAKLRIADSFDDIARSMGNITKSLNRYADVYVENTKFARENDKEKELMFRSEKVFNKMNEIFEFLNDCCLKGFCIDTSCVDSIDFHPYSLKQLLIDFNSYVDYVKSTDNIDKIKQKSEEILSLIPDCYRESFNDIFFPVSVEFALMSTRCINENTKMEKNYFEIDNDKQQVCPLTERDSNGKEYQMNYFWVPNRRKYNKKDSKKKLDIKFNGYVDSGDVKGYNHCYKEKWNGVCNAPYYEWIEYTETQKKEYQKVCVIDYVIKYALKTLKREEFQKEFYDEYLRYLSETFTKLSVALLELKRQLLLTIKNKEVKRIENQLSSDMISNIEHYSDEQIGAYIKKRVLDKNNKK